MKTVKIFLSVLLISLESFSGGITVPNGGTFVKDGDQLKVADIYLKRSFHRFDLPPEVLEKLREMDSLLSNITRKDGLETFFSEHVFSAKVTYLLVDELPEEGCNYMPKNKLPMDLLHYDLGCTKGYTTYVKKKGLPTDPLQIALFIVHERLQAYAHGHSFEAKADIVHSLYILMNHFVPAAESNDLNFKFEKVPYADELEKDVLNRLSLRLAQIKNSPFVKPLEFYINGAICYGECKLDEKVMMSPGTYLKNVEIIGENIILQGGSYTDSVVKGNDIKFFQSNINTSNISEGNEVEFNQSTINGSNITLNNSKFESNEISNSIIRGANLFLKATKITGFDLDLKQAEFENVKLEGQTDWKPTRAWGIKFPLDREGKKTVADKITLKRSTVFGDINGSVIHIEDSTIDANIEGENITFKRFDYRPFANLTIRGRNLNISDSWISSEIYSSAGSDRPLEHVTIENVKLTVKNPGSTAKLANYTSVSNIYGYHGKKTNIEFGQQGRQTAFNGLGETYQFFSHFKFFDDTVFVKNQDELEGYLSKDSWPIEDRSKAHPGSIFDEYDLIIDLSAGQSFVQTSDTEGQKTFAEANIHFGGIPILGNDRWDSPLKVLPTNLGLRYETGDKGGFKLGKSDISVIAFGSEHMGREVKPGEKRIGMHFLFGSYSTRPTALNEELGIGGLRSSQLSVFSPISVALNIHVPLGGDNHHIDFDTKFGSMFDYNRRHIKIGYVWNQFLIGAEYEKWEEQPSQSEKLEAQFEEYEIGYASQSWGCITGSLETENSYQTNSVEREEVDARTMSIKYKVGLSSLKGPCDLK